MQEGAEKKLLQDDSSLVASFPHFDKTPSEFQTMKCKSLSYGLSLFIEQFGILFFYLQIIMTFIKVVIYISRLNK